MAVMIPDTISDTAPPSEQNIFEKLKHIPKEWMVFHSVHVKLGSDPRPREIDFLILMPEYYSVICLEVKGGRYTINRRKWYRRSDNFLLNPSPPDQARDAMFALGSRFPSYFSGRSPLSLGCAVAFPDGDLENQNPPDHLAKMWFSSDIRGPNSLFNCLDEYANELYNNNLKRLKKTYGLDMDIQNAEIAFHKLRNDLEQNMSIKPPSPQTIFRSDLETLRPQLLRLTTDQFNSLSRVNDNDHIGWVIDGAAGTGKTVLAMELAKQRCEAGETVALLCSNPNLSRRFEIWAETLPEDKGGKVVAGTPATLPLLAFSEKLLLVERHQQRLGASPLLEESLKFGYLDNKWESFIEETIKDLEQGVIEEIFDYLIVDEAQNLCDEVFLKLMDVLLKNGLTKGRWAMFGDFTNQNIVSPELIDGKTALKDFGLNWVNEKLETNCRNTYEIADEFVNLVDIESPLLPGVHGPDVQFEYFASKEKLETLLDRLVADLRKRKFNSRQIILLSSDNDAFNTGHGYGGWQLLNIREKDNVVLGHEDDPLNVSGDHAPLRYSDIYDFQGLESDVAILILPVTNEQTVTRGGVTLPREKHLRKMLYTGMSRAKIMLIIVAHEGYETTINSRRRIKKPPSR